MPSSPRGYIKSPTNELSNQSVKGSSDGLLPGNGHHGHSMEPRRRAVTGNDIVNANASTNGMQESPAATLTLRSLVSSKEAGVIIGKGGANVAAMREKSGVKAGVSKVVPGVHHRVLTVSGSLEGVAKAFSLIASTLLDNPAVPGPTINGSSASVEGQATIRLLISHTLMGTVIGRQGLKIKHIQDTSGVRMIASKEMLPSSTERSVEVQGTVQGIESAITEIGRCLLEDWERGQGNIPFQPGLETAGSGGLLTGADGMLLPLGVRRVSPTIGATSAMSTTSRVRRGGPTPGQPAAVKGANTNAAAAVNPGGSLVMPAFNGAPIPAQVVEGDVILQNISIPSDMVGCIIGKGGSKITEIRRLSGSQISIAKMTHDESGERMFTIQGTVETNEKALFLLYQSLEGEKIRRAEAAAAEAAQASGGSRSMAGQQAIEV